MEISEANENGVYEDSHREIVAQYGRWFAAVDFAFCEDSLYRYGVSLAYSYGGFGGPIFASALGFASLSDARAHALEELLRRWHKPFPSEPRSVHDELRILREQIERALQQPSFL
jgi:hypothetical protein